MEGMDGHMDVLRNGRIYRICIMYRGLIDERVARKTGGGNGKIKKNDPIPSVFFSPSTSTPYHNGFSRDHKADGK